jgi:hypothetical protein
VIYRTLSADLRTSLDSETTALTNPHFSFSLHYWYWIAPISHPQQFLPSSLQGVDSLGCWLFPLPSTPSGRNIATNRIA